MRAKGMAPSTVSAETRGLGIESALTDVAGQGAVASAEAAKMQGLPLARLTGTRTEAQQIAALGKNCGAPPTCGSTSMLTKQTLELAI